MPGISTFGGIVPRLSKHLLPEGAALKAHDVKLRNGRLEAWREPLELYRTEPGVVSFTMRGCCPVVWDKCVSATDFLPEYDRLYLSGRSSRPEMATFVECVPTYHPLGVPYPTVAPTVAGAETVGSRTSASRSYVYTYENRYGEESAPSPASAHLSIQDGTPVTLTTAAPPAGWEITRVSIYRTGTGYREGSEKTEEAMTDFLYVGQTDAITRVFIDTVQERYLGSICSTREHRPPPAELRHLKHINGTGTLVGCTADMVHFSRNMQPWNWPAEFDLTLPANIVNLVTFGQTVYVSTDRQPFVIDGRLLQSRHERAVTDAGVALPDIGCGHAASAIATPHGMVYAGMDGLVLLSPQGQATMLTAHWYSAEEWKRLRPDTIRMAYWRGCLIFTTDVASFCLVMNDKLYGDSGALSTLSDRPTHWYLSGNGELLLLKDGSIWQWDAGEALRPYAWESRELTFGGAYSPTSAKVRTTGVTLKLLTDRVEWSRFVKDETPVRLKRMGRHLFYRMGFEGTGTVEFAELGTSHATVLKGA